MDEDDASQSGRIRTLHGELRDRIRAIQLLTENLPVVMWTTDRDLRCTSVTGAGLTAMKLRPTEVVGRLAEEVLGYFDSKAPVFAAHQMALDGKPAPFELEFKGRHLQAHVSPQRSSSGAVVGCVGIALDITERIQAERSLQHRERQLDDLFENTPVGLHMLDNDAQILRANRAELAILGYSPEEYIGHQITDFFIDLRLANDVKSRLHCHENLNELETSLRCRDNRVKYVQMSCNWYVEDGKPLYSRGFLRDVTEIRSSWAQLNYKATHDPLTGALNRASFMERLENASRNAMQRQFAVLFIDVDNLKKINETHGHAVGDELLVEVTRAMQSCVRPGDLISRFAGDEFAVLIFDVPTEADARTAAVRIQRELAAASRLNKRGVVPSLSIGISLCQSRDTPERMIQDADRAMYDGKSAGKSSVRIAVRYES